MGLVWGSGEWQLWGPWLTHTSLSQKWYWPSLLRVHKVAWCPYALLGPWATRAEAAVSDAAQGLLAASGSWQPLEVKLQLQCLGKGRASALWVHLRTHGQSRQAP